MASLKKQMAQAIKDRPKYAINEENYDNQSIAKARAFGRDRKIQMAEENVDSDIAANIGQAKNISGSSGAILDTLRSLGTSGMQVKRDLAGTEADLQGQKIGDLYGANTALSEEKDKAWNYNVNEPYMNKIQELRDKRKFRQDLLFKTLDLAGNVAGAALTGGASTGVSAGRAAAGAAASAVPSTFTSSDVRGVPEYNDPYARFNRTGA